MEGLDDFKAERYQQYPAIGPLWESSRAESVPLLGYDLENPADDLHDERGRLAQGPLPARGEGARAIPQRGRRWNASALSRDRMTLRAEGGHAG
jgi:hypothetical protein